MDCRFFSYPYLLLPIKYQELVLYQPKKQYSQYRRRYILLTDTFNKHQRYSVNCIYLSNNSYNLCDKFFKIKKIEKVNAFVLSNKLYGADNALIIKNIYFKDINNTNRFFNTSQNMIYENINYHHTNQLYSRIMFFISFSGLLIYFLQKDHG